MTLDLSLLANLGSIIEHEGMTRVQEARDRASTHQAEVLDTVAGQLRETGVSSFTFGFWLTGFLVTDLGGQLLAKNGFLSSLAALDIGSVSRTRVLCFLPDLPEIAKQSTC